MAGKGNVDSLSEYLKSAVDAASKAGEVIRKGFYESKNVEHKGLVDLVTETDKACEELIFNHLKQLYPTHKFIGEETTAACGTTELTDQPTWIVDPLDGTTNFVHGFPFVCVSIGLTIGKIPTIGVVYNPIINELFTGIRGKGAFLNGLPIKVSSQTELMNALLATEAGTKRDKLTVDASTKRINSLLFKVRSLRMSGSCALNLCGVACGRLDAFYEVGFGGPWDVAGGAVIVREAGGVIFDPSGADFDITSQRVAATNPFLKDALVAALRETEKKMAGNGNVDSLSEYLASAIGIAREAGDVIRRGFDKSKHVEHNGLVDLVTEIENTCEKLIFNHIKQLYPTHKLLVEKETTHDCGTTELTDEPTWIVNPLDGTTNFVHGYPFVCVSIGLTIEQIPTVGVVYNPILNELFTGIRGKGAFLNESPIKVSSQTELISALLATEAGIKRDKLTVDALTKRINSLLFKVRSLRMSGSCALNLCGVACGRLDAYYEVGFGGPWKVAGGAVIVREAGGVMFDMSGEDFDITAQGVVTSNPFFITTLLAALTETERVRNLEAMDMEAKRRKIAERNEEEKERE